MLDRSLVLTIICAVVLMAQEPANPNRILRPTNGASLAIGKLEGIAKVAKVGTVLLDGSLIPTTEKAPGVLTFILNPQAGRHTLELRFEGGREVINFDSGELPEKGKPFRLHPPVAPCETCHAVKSGAWSFKSDLLETTCAGCHNLKEFAKTHTHNTGQLAECGMCHHPHGSTESFHLKYPRNVACKQCHG